MEIVWLASYPRSGNTFLRTILWQCFGLHSASIYPNDLGGKIQLEKYVGHIEHESNGKILFPPNSIPLIKTHEHPQDQNPAIYVVRDGRAVTVSLWKFYHQDIPLEEIIEGRHRFGTWASHVRAWKPYERPNTLMLRYEDMKSNLPNTLNKISIFLNRNILKEDIPDRNTIASVDGRWVKTESDWRLDLGGELLDKFSQLNGDMLTKMGYSTMENGEY